MANDLRDGNYFRRWVSGLPEDARDLLENAAVEYLPFDDTLRVIFTVGMRDRMQAQDAREQLMEHIRAFYDCARQRWSASARGGCDRGAPQHVVMPRVEFQVAPTIKAAN